MNFIINEYVDILDNNIKNRKSLINILQINFCKYFIFHYLYIKVVLTNNKI